jgi:hypothetical protein
LAVVGAGTGERGSAKRRVDVGSWAAITIGADGGRGSDDFCRPLEQRPELFPGHEDDSRPAVRIAVRLVFPDQDVSRVSADVRVRDADGRPFQGAAARVVDRAVEAMLELLRGLGGEATASSLDVEVSCDVQPPVESSATSRKAEGHSEDGGDGADASLPRRR